MLNHMTAFLKKPLVDASEKSSWEDFCGKTSVSASRHRGGWVFDGLLLRSASKMTTFLEKPPGEGFRWVVRGVATAIRGADAGVVKKRFLSLLVYIVNKRSRIGYSCLSTL